MAAHVACSPTAGVLAGMTDPDAIEQAVCALFRPPQQMPADVRAMVAPDGQWKIPGIGQLAMSPAPGIGQAHTSPGDAARAMPSSDSLGGAPEHALRAKLEQAETEWLSSDRVATRGVTETELARRFQQVNMSDAPSDVGQYMDSLVQGVVRDSIHCSAPKMIGHMTSSLPYFLRPLSRLVTTLNQNTVKTETAKTITFLERESLAMVHRVLYRRSADFYKRWVQDPDTILGLFTSGGTLANVSALWVARNMALGPKDDFPGVEKAGIAAALKVHGYAGAVVIGSRLLHYSLAKATDVLGMGVNSMKLVAYDDNYKVKLDLVEEAIQECRKNNILIVCLVAVGGATETGTIDPIDGLANLSEKYNIHLHVDAAWGGPCIFSSIHREKLAGIERAHSVTLDGHKQLYMPMGCGLCLLREPDMVNVVKKTANYIIRKESYDLGKFTIEGSRPANALYLHANLSILGVKGYGALVDRSVRLTRYMADTVHQLRNFEVVADPMTNILLYRHVPEDLYEATLQRPLTEAENKRVDKVNVQMQTAQKDAGRTFVSRTTVYSPRQGRPVVALRVVIANPLTTREDIDAVLADQQRILEHGGDDGGDDDGELVSAGVGSPPSIFADPSAPRVWGVSPTQAMCTPPNADPAGAANAYWDTYWSRMPPAVKNMYGGDKANFMSQLQAANRAPQTGAELDT
eukprot:TRINITY_DN2604_c0_g1_i1.p1 TRINITY_DN2604_c0_g1~~TRINITY_DN2604_c0_g1_i1.p1  ORF type:complete len:723 (+),score=240.69 TRINITY_DN2604_c0_g1_i1:100-2169(+)